MTTALPDLLQYGKVTWRAVTPVADSTDPGDEPDALPVTGTVTFTPSAKVLLANGTPPVTVLAAPVTYTLDPSGVLRDASGRDSVTLVATDSPGVTPTGWTWTVSYNLNGGVSRGSMSFALPAGGTVDLTSITPVTSSAGTPVIQGPPGPQGEAGPPWTGSEDEFTTAVVGVAEGIVADAARRLCFNVLDYGAVGDGATDDRPAVQAALDAAHSVGGGVVLFPGGRNYLIATPRLTVRANTTITAYGATITKVNTGFAFLRNFDQGADNFPGYTGNSGIKILGGTWNGNATNPQAGGNFFSFAHCSDILVRDCRFIDVGADSHAVEFNAVRDSAVINCRALGFKSVGGTNSEAFQLDIANAAALCAPQDNTACTNIRVIGCSVGPSDSLPSWPRMTGSHNAVAGVRHEGVTVARCYADGCTDTPIRLYQTSGVIVANNRIKGAGAQGIQLRVGDAPNSYAIDRAVIVGNQIQDTAGDGIQVMGFAGAMVWECSVADNHIWRPGGNGVGVSYSYGVAVTDNHVVQPGSTGVSVAFSDDSVVQGNRVRAGAVDGVAVGDSKLCNVVGNTVRTVARYGVLLSPNAVDCAVRANHVASAAQGAYRASSNSNNNAFVGNTARLDGVTAFSGAAFTATGSCTGLQRWGNDWLGMGAGAVADSSITPNTSAADRT